MSYEEHFLPLNEGAENELTPVDDVELESMSDDSYSSFKSIDSLKDSLAYMSNIMELPKALETNAGATLFLPGQMGKIDPLTFVTLNIPRMTKPHLVDMLFQGFQNCIYRLDKNPPNHIPDMYFENDMISFLSQHPDVTNPTLLRRQFAVTVDEINTQVANLEHKEFSIIATNAQGDGILRGDVSCAICFWRFEDVNRLDKSSTHFTRFVIYCLVKDEPPIDFANLIAVLLENPQIYSVIWNSLSQEEITNTILESKSSFLADLAVAHQAMEKMNDRLISSPEGLEVSRTHWLQRRMLMSHDMTTHKHEIEDEEINCTIMFKGFGQRVIQDFKRRIPYYWSDWRDGFNLKPLWVGFFLALGILPYVFIFGASIQKYTSNYMNTWHVLVSTIISGICMSVFSPQPMIFLSPSAAFILFLKTSKNLAETAGTTLSDLYPLMSIFHSIFLILFALLNVSSLMKYVTSFSDEVFVAFVAVLFLMDSIKVIMEPEDQLIQIAGSSVCFAVFVITYTVNKMRMNSLTFGWVRSIASDMAPIISTITVFIVLRFVWPNVYNILPQYKMSDLSGDFRLINLSNLNAGQWALAALLGFSAAILTFFEHNITAKLVNGEEMKLAKPPAYHLDLLVLGIVNLILGILSMPTCVASKLHTFHHIHAMSVHTFEFDDEGNPSSLCINVQETRLTGLISHILLVIILFFPDLMKIPKAIFAGVLAFMGFVTLLNTQLVTQLFSLVWRPENLPPEHWLRNVARWKVFLLDILQIGCIVAIYFIEHSVIGFLYPIFVVIIVIMYRIIYRFFESDIILLEHGAA